MPKYLGMEIAGSRSVGLPKVSGFWTGARTDKVCDKSPRASASLPRRYKESRTDNSPPFSLVKALLYGGGSVDLFNCSKVERSCIIVLRVWHDDFATNGKFAKVRLELISAGWNSFNGE